MQTKSDVLAAIGGTPLIRLARASEETGCTILGKAEFLNPGLSVKDRAALSIVQDAEAKGLIRPGGTIVEGTAGNTGIGLALVAAVRGYRTVIVIPETQSAEKKATLRLAGARLVEVPAVPFSNPNNYVHAARRLAEKLAATESAGAFFADQFDNVANRQAHIDHTGPEIFEQTDGTVDGFVCACGTGGTLAGIAEALRARKPGMTIALSDPDGSALHAYYTTGTLKAESSSITEGIGQGRITKNLEGFKPDVSFRIPDTEAVAEVFQLMQDEGLSLGGSSGINVAGAIRLARHLGPGHTIVTILCDGAARYASKLFNPDFLKEKGLPTPDWLGAESGGALPDWRAEA
ncbi:cysteine synthase A [Methylobacterium sp. C25]|uniref:cysteine synthase A n=1 Tax=Methylobacterium sp. C25 TaxID=2721622 RepID=UPI001F27DAE2|nr:cysteine synthase A [Methylobacterium sp. C25]MCE4223154.1 cysteine synthase A [Methylobacterium sp. C25]